MALAQGVSGGSSRDVGQDCNHLRARPGLEDLLPSSLMWLLAGSLSSLLCVGQRPSFLTTWASQDTQLASPRGNDPRERPRGSCRAFYNLVSEVTYWHICFFLLVAQTNLIQCGRTLHKRVNTKTLGLLGAIMEAGYCSA